MTTHRTTRCATAAIAVALALASTGLSAQAVLPEGAPPSAPPSAPPFPTGPTFVLPESNEPILIPQPVPQSSAPTQAVETEAETPSLSAPEQTSMDAAAQVPAAQAQSRPDRIRPAVPAPQREAEPAAAPVDEPFAADSDPLFVPPVDLDPGEGIVVAEVEESAGSPDLLDLAGYFLGVLLLLSVAGFVLGRPRKPRRIASKIAAKPPQADLREASPVAVPLLAVATASPPVAALPVHRRDSARGPAVALPRCIPDNFAERDALLKRMIAAAPDRANPFRSRKARIHRARLILQSLGRDFRSVDPWIDLGDYPGIWPELARRRYPHAA
jgi:hypothetical protein